MSLNYASTTVDTDLARAFESALADARAESDVILPHLVGGHEVAEGEAFDRADPAHPDRVVSRARHADDNLVRRAVEAARSAQREWRQLPATERAEHLRAAQAELAERTLELAGIISAETGKSRLEAIGEANEAVDLIDEYAGQLEESDGYRTTMGSNDDRETNTDVLRPYGVFAVIGPFNFPAALCVGMASAALLMGNAIVLKPSDKAPASGHLIGEILARHLPDGVVNVLHGGVPTGQALAGADIDGIAFTGSAEVGWGLVHAMSSGAYAKPVLAEMGGKNVTIVTASADLDAAAEGITRSSFGLSGQKCSANSRVVVDRSVHDELVAKLVHRGSELVVGPPESEASYVGPLIDPSAVARFEDAVAQAAKDGQVVLGGDRPELPGYYASPTVVTGLPVGHDLTRRELFVPFVTVTAVDSFDDALAEANAVDYGLTAGVFSGEQAEIDEFLDRIEAGVVYVNRRTGSTTGAWPGIQTFCGWKSSGSSGKGGLGPWYLQGFAREQSRTVWS